MKSKNQLGLTLSLVLLSATTAIAQPKPTTSPGLAPSPTISTQQQKELEKLQQEKEKLQQEEEIRNTVQTEVDRAFSRTTTMLNILLVVLTAFPVLITIIALFFRHSIINQVLTQIKQDITNAKDDALQKLQKEMQEIKDKTISEAQNSVAQTKEEMEKLKDNAISKMNKDVSEVEKHKKKAMERLNENFMKQHEPENPKLLQSAENYFNQGNPLCLLGDYEGAIKLYDQAIQIQPFHEVYQNRGVALFFLDREEEALVSFNKAIELQPEFYQAWYSRGVALLKRTKDIYLGPGSLDLSEESKKQYQDAIESFKKTIEIEPEYHRAWYDRAECYAIIQKGDLAIEDLKEAIRLNSEYKTKAKTNNYFDEIREDERFKKLIED
jgi:tetratricopeptide (TPR) repeat protein